MKERASGQRSCGEKEGVMSLLVFVHSLHLDTFWLG